MRRVRVGSRIVLGAIAVIAALQVSVIPEQAPQTPGPPTGTGLLMGTVVDGLGDRPVGGVLVNLYPPERQVVTDSRGRFVFTNLPKGTYSLWAVKPGFISGRPGQRRPGGGSLPLVIGDGDRIGDLKVPVWKQASIAGTIVDDVGEPVVDLPVRVLIRSIVAGRPRLTPNLTVRTDDRGAYRIGGLAPGEYVVIVPSTQSTAPESIVDLYRQSRQAGNQLDPQTAETLRALTAGGAPAALTMAQSAGTLRIGSFSFQSAAGTARSALPSSPSADGRMFVYPAQYYPNAATPAQATVISLQSGEERAGVNLQLRLVPTVRISGVVTGPDGPVMTNLALMPGGDELAGDSGLELATSVSDANGRFTFLGVPSGQYLLRVVKRAPAASPLATLWASDRISVGAVDMSDLAVTLRSAVRLSGTSVFEDGSRQPAPEVIRQVVIAAESVEGRLLAAGQLAADGRFTTVDLVPGAYYLRVLSSLPGWTFKSAMLDGRDISNVPVVVDRSLNGVVVTFTARPSEVNGRVLNTTGAADSAAAVLVFPAESAAWIDHGFSPRRLRAVRVDKEGAFRIAGLPPGDYLVAAIPDEASANAFDPRILQSLSRLATTMTLADGESRSLSLKTLAVPR